MTVKKWKHSGTKKHSMSDREIRNGLLSEKAAEEGIVPYEKNTQGGTLENETVI